MSKFKCSLHTLSYTTIFSNNTSLTVNGTLSAVGTSASPITFDFTAPSSTYQNGIKFNSGSSGTLSYCNIKNAYHGVKCYSSLPTIQYCDIFNNSTGIYIYNAGSRSSPICNNNIHNNSTNGIFIYNSTVINVHNNVITNNGECGLYCTSNGVPYLWENIISNNGQAGVYCIINSPAFFGDRGRHPGYNLITQNYTGVTCGLESDVRIGTSSLAGRNSIHDNTGYEVTSTYDSYVMAEYNWWNRYPPTYPNYYYGGDFYTFMGGTIDYVPALTYDPIGGGLAKTVAYDLNEPGSNPPTGSASSIFLDSELIEALNYLFDEKYEDAIAIYVRRLNKETDKSRQKYILSCIAECYELSGKDGFIEYLNNDVRQNLSRKDELYAKTLELENYALMREGNIQKAIDNYLIMKNDFASNEAIHKNALFNLGYLHYVALDNRTQGKTYFDEFVQKYADDDLNLIIFETMGEPEKWTLAKKNTPPISDEASVAVLPSEYRLLNNYPNPFNPSTTIAYDLQEESYVILTIYDIVGREIIRLVDNIQPAGSLKVIWDGKDSFGQIVPSGIYLYSLKTTSGFNATKKMAFMR
ncbi:MAG TPA: right-handed parallel beta-helix repeat-containing protein [Candidatus Marinimicrobia bacterium]|nr:right-handed parallel beta-helix repeat-containing protein [Candidatus Neomarinimicrobiota bacterium]